MMISLELSDAQRIVEVHLPDYTLTNLHPLPDTGPPNTRRYLLDLSPEASAFLLVASPVFPAPTPGPYHSNSFQTASQLFAQVLANTTTALPPPPILDTSQTITSLHLLVSPALPVSAARLVALDTTRPILSPRESVLLDLRLGQFFGQIHSRVQNDAFGIPTAPSSDLTLLADSAYSWQETFTALLEDLLARVAADPPVYGLDSVTLPDQIEDARRSLSRAIGFFLFDDVEVPALVWFTGSEADVYLLSPPPISADVSSEPDPHTIAYILPTFANALWGDPLLETVMMTDRSPAFMEGYLDGGGAPLIIFPRHKTKRLWYTIFLALVVLIQSGPVQEDVEGIIFEDHVKKSAWARKTLLTCFEKLKDAPCY